MEEPDERDASLGVSESTVVDDSSVSVNKEQVRNLLSEEEVGRAEGGDGACNAGGEDIMVEVLGSDVYFDGVCTDRTAGNLDEVGSTGEDPNVERACGDVSVVDEPDVGVSCGVESEGVSGVGESIKETTQEGVEGDESVLDAAVLDNNAQTDDSLAVASHVDTSTEASHLEDGNIGSQEAMEMDAQVVSFQGSIGHSSSNDKVLINEELHKVEIHTEKLTNSPIENGIGDDSESVHAGEGSQFITKEASISDGGKSLEKKPGQKSLEEGKKLVDMPDDQQGTELGISGVDARNPEIKTSTSSADGIENLNSLGPDATEEAPGMCSQKDLNPEVISHGNGAENDLSNLERDESCIVETGHEDVGKSDHVDDQNEVDIGGEHPTSTLTYGKKISSDEPLGLCAGSKSVDVLEKAAQAVDNENLDPGVTLVENVMSSDSAIAVTENVAHMDSISSSRPNHNAQVNIAAENVVKILVPSTTVSTDHEQNLNVQIECRNLESDPQSNGQGGGIGMNVEENAVVDSNLTDFENVEGMEVDQSFNSVQVLHGEEEMEDVTGIDNGDDLIVECAGESPESSVKLHQARYQLPSENEGDFSVSDLVWGKVRSHPWWPGQIFDPSDSSDKAMKYYKKDFFLVAYFGDRTFAWNEVSHLKPFRTYFSQEEMQSHSEAFQNSVECALEEVSRRSELGLACACTPREAYDMIECQVIENAGIRTESSRRYGVDNSASATSFEPAKLIEYIRDLAKFPSDGSDRLDLVIAKAQLTSFYRLKGYCGLPQFQFGGQFQFCGGLVDRDLDSLGIEMQSSEYVQHAASCQDDAHTYKENLEGRSSSYHKRKHNLKDGLYPKRKDKSLYELMGENLDNPDGDNWSDANMTATLVSPSTKRRKTEHPTDDSGMPDGRKTISSAKVSGTATLKQSFKIGDCIRRVASQMTGTPPIVKSNSERFERPDGTVDGRVAHESDIFLQNFDEAQRERVNLPTQYSSLDELLGELHLVASDPMKEYSFVNVIVSFFTDFRDSLILRQQPGIEEATDKISGKRRAHFTPVVLSQTFEFEDMSDTYWTDRVIQNGTEVQPPRKIRKRDYQLSVAEPGKALQGCRRPYKKRHPVGNHAMTTEMFTGSVNLPSSAELVMNFAEVDSVPSEKTLNNMFRRFGPLRESETEVDREGGRARVVFKKSSDAEIAYGTAGRFNIFGPRLVNYQLSYTPSTLFKASPIPRLQDQEMHLDLSSTQFQEMQLDLSSFHDHDLQLDLSSIHDQDMQLDLSTIEYQEMESVLGPNHDRKPNYSAHLGEMQDGFATIQYERQSDLSSMHDQELQTVFALNQETQSGHVTAQDQELHHHFTSTQLGEMQADHTTTSHHDEPLVSASAQEQNMEPVFAKIKEEKTQPAITTLQEESQSVLQTIQEQETHSVLDAPQLGRMQADLTPTHHEKQTVHATSLEQEMQPVFATIQEGTLPVLASSQEQVAIVGTTIVHHEEQPVPSTPQEQDMQPVLAASIQENEMLPLTFAQDHGKEPLATSEELLGEPGSSITEVQEAQHTPVTMKRHEEDVLGTKEQTTESDNIAAHEEDVLGTKEQTTQSVSIAAHEQEVTQSVVLMGEEAQRDTQLATTTFTDGQETQVLVTVEAHESEHDFGLKEQATQSVIVTDVQDDTQPLVLNGKEGQEETQPVFASMQELTVPDLPSVQELAHDHVTTEEHEAVPDSLTSQVQDVQSNATELEQDLLPDNPTNEVHYDDDSKHEQELQHANNTNLEQEMQCDIATDQEQEKQYAKAADKEQEKQWDSATASDQEQEKQCDNATSQEQEMQCDNAMSQEQEMQCGDTTNREQEMQCDDAVSQEQEMQRDGSTSHAVIREQEMKCDDTTIQKQEMKCDDATIQEQEMKCDDTTIQELEMKCDDTTSREQELQCGDSTHGEQEMQSDNVGSQEQEIQFDKSMSQEQEMKCDASQDEMKCEASREEEMKCDASREEMKCDASQDEEMKCDASQEQEMQFDNTTSQEQKMQCDIDSDNEPVVQSGEVASNEQVVQSEHQELQADHATNQEQETESSFATLKEDIKLDVAVKHPTHTQDQVTKSDVGAIPESETHSTGLTKD